MKRTQTVRLKITLRRVTVASGCFLFLAIGMFILLNLGSKKEANAAVGNETIASGAFIINMGISPQTYANGLKPYGMLYDLIVNYKIPIKWVINQTKARDGIDFTYNAINYSAGPFIIEPTYISSTIAARITYWQTQGVVGVYTSGSITVPVYNTITNFPTVSIDTISGKENIIIAYYTNAGIPSTAYTTGSPSQLTGCVDIWTNPHGDPTWATHKDLYNFVTIYKSWIWAECHAVSTMEGCKDPSSPFNQLNFLTSKGLQCYSNNKCGTNILESHGGNATAPYTYNYPTDPVMQFLGDMHQAASSGSEDWYIPVSTGKWNTNTKELVNTSDGSGSKKGVKMVYGPAYNDSTNGYIMYEAGHDLDGSGTTAQKVAAQRAYFNFLLRGGIPKALNVTATVPATAYAKDKVDISANIAQGNAPYTYKWTSALGAVFSSSTQAVSKYHVPDVSTTTTDVITMTGKDNCNRQSFITKTITILSTLPIKLKSFDAYVISSGVKVTWTTASEVNNDFFSVLRSLDNVNFIEIGRVRGAGNSSVNLDYTFTDDHPYDGISYYKLKQTDFDGHSETFKTVSVDLQAKLNDLNSIRIFPNPFNDYFTAEFESKENKNVQVEILNLNGSIVFSEHIMLEEGKNSHRFTTSENMKTGIYIFRISDESAVLSDTKIYCRKN